MSRPLHATVSALCAALLLSVAGNAHSQAPASPAVAQRPLKQPAGDCLNPEYPLAARRSGAEGSTRVVFIVERDGSTTNPRVARRSGNTKAHALLDEAAVQALLRCNFGEAPDHEPTPVALDLVWKLAPDPLAPRPIGPPAR